MPHCSADCDRPGTVTANGIVDRLSARAAGDGAVATYAMRVRDTGTTAVTEPSGADTIGWVRSLRREPPVSPTDGAAHGDG